MRSKLTAIGARPLAALLCAWAAAACAHQPPAARAPLVIAVIGDQTGADDLDAAYAVLSEAVDAVNALAPDIVLHTGDLLESRAPEDIVRAQWADARARLDRLEADWLMVPGDHDVNPPGWVANSPDRSRERLFQSLLGEVIPEARAGLYYARDVEDVRIIALNAHERLHVDPRWGNIFLAEISDDQLAWLDAALAAAPQPRARVVFLHQPLWYNAAGWDRVHAVLARHEVDLVVAGHFHYDQIEAERDGVRYLIVGAAGGRTKTGSAELGASDHVTRIAIGADTLDIGFAPLNGAPAQTFSSRALMDRAQALDVGLGSLAFNPQFAPSAALEGDACALALPVIANPIDIPIDVEVRLADPRARLNQARFADGTCAHEGGDACRLPPSFGVVSSNNSSVRLRAGETDFWRARVAFDGATPQTTELVITARFDFEGAEHWLETRETVSLSACAG